MHESEVVKTLPKLQVVLGVSTATLLAAGPTLSELDEACLPVLNKFKQSLGSRFLTISCAIAKTVNKHNYIRVFLIDPEDYFNLSLATNYKLVLD